MPFRRRPPARSRIGRPVGSSAIVASGERLDGGNSREVRTLFQPWQVTSLATYSSVGECWYAAQFYARSLSKLRLFVGRRDEQGEIAELEPTDPAAELLERVRDGSGGKTELLGTYGRLMFLVGEALLTVTGEGTPEEKWEFLSPLELRPIPGGKGYVRQEAPGLELEQLAAAENDDESSVDEATVWRVWRRHPTYSKWADSPMAAVLALFEELALLQLAVRARSKARANRGILVIADEYSFPSPDGSGDEDPAKDTLMEDLSQVLLAPIKDPGAPSAVVPFVLRVPGSVMGASGTPFSAKDGIFHIPLIDPAETNDEEQAKEAIIKRIAIGLDLPPEILTGMSDVNHWGAWQIDEASWTAHVQPMADQLVADLSSTYLRPAAEEAQIADWESLVIGYDAADVINHPDRTNDVREAFRDLVASPKIYIETIGLEEDDLMSPEEAEFYSKLRRGSSPDDEPPADAATVEIGPPPEPTEEIIQGAKDDEELRALGASANGNGDLVARIVGAAEMAVERTRELAGSRLVQRARGCDDCKAKIADVPSSLVASALGIEEAARLAPGVILTEGGTSSFAATLARMNVERPVVAKLCQLVETHARESLFASEPAPLPRAFADYVARVA